MHRIATKDDWLAARLESLEEEKAFQRGRDELAKKRRDLPWRRIDTNYMFAAEDGPKSLLGLFDGLSQLIVYHFMFHPDWAEGCKSCSFWADSFNGSVFARERDDVFHTYSTFARGLDPYNATYQLLDIAPFGRNEDELPYPMDWVRRNDEY